MEPGKHLSEAKGGDLLISPAGSAVKHRG
jgi:hypothetical protein